MHAAARRLFWLVACHVRRFMSREGRVLLVQLAVPPSAAFLGEALVGFAAN